MIPIKLIRIAEIFLISAYLMSEYASYLVFCILRELCRINQGSLLLDFKSEEKL